MIISYLKNEEHGKPVKPVFIRIRKEEEERFKRRDLKVVQSVGKQVMAQAVTRGGKSLVAFLSLNIFNTDVKQANLLSITSRSFAQSKETKR